MGAILAAAPKLIEGGLTIAGAMKDRKAINKRLGEAQGEFRQARDRYKNFQFTNPFEQMENAMEDLKVSTTAFDAQAQAQDAASAAALESMVAAGVTGTGAAQSILAQQMGAQQQTAAKIAQMEMMNQRLSAEGAMKTQELKLQGREDLQSQQYIQVGELTNLASDELRAANLQKKQNQAMFMGGVGTLAQGLFPKGISLPGKD